VTSALVDTFEDVSGPTKPRPLRWWREAIFAAVFYACYSAVRDVRGSKPVSRLQAFHNARRVIRVERIFGLYQEHRIQHLFIGEHGFLRFWNVFYGSAHFIFTLIVLLWLFRRAPARYPMWRNALACTTAVALIGFAFFPLMPPRLLPSSYHFVDTLHAFGGLWSFDSGAVNRVSNQYAAMPSLHFAWAIWCALALLPAMRRVWTKALMLAYPVLTLFCIVVTANHYLLDAVGGAVVLAVGFALALALAKVTGARSGGGPEPPESEARRPVAGARRPPSPVAAAAR
jgi:membrane-associated phospholipid phosphatase